MHPEKALRAEHETIRRSLAVLGGLTDALREGHRVSNTDLFGLLNAIEELVTSHHVRESQVVFPRLRKAQGGPGKRALRGIEERQAETSGALAGIRELVDPATAGDWRARDRIARRTDAFADEMRDLLDTEEATYLTALDATLPRADLDALEGALEPGPGGPGEVSPDDVRPRVEALADEYRRLLGS